MDDENHGMKMHNLEQQQEQCQNICKDSDKSLEDSQSSSSWPCHRSMLYVEALTGILLISVIWWLVTWNTIHAGEIRTDKPWDLVVLIMLYITSVVAGQVITIICNLPSLVGMVLAGIAFGIFGLPINESYTLDIFYFFVRCVL